jgi:hypothetical protein
MNKPKAPVRISQNHTFSNVGLQNSLTRTPKFKAPKFVIKTKTNGVENKYLDNEMKGSRSPRVNVLGIKHIQFVVFKLLSFLLQKLRFIYYI